jgi:hypothetical protein
MLRSYPWEVDQKCSIALKAGIIAPTLGHGKHFYENEQIIFEFAQFEKIRRSLRVVLCSSFACSLVREISRADGSRGRVIWKSARFSFETHEQGVRNVGAAVLDQLWQAFDPVQRGRYSYSFPIRFL